ncbi:MAG TPA: MFS transporter [Terriglobales bacterium]|nr:MFS transporter [Terriglobales bacterium]
MTATNSSAAGFNRRWAFRFVIFLGVVSFFADMTYEGARSITGPFLQSLGASATVVGIVAGFGELVAYGLRLFSGRIADRTGEYWPITICGYMLNLLSVPLLTFAASWPVASLLIILERTGKAVRNPARDAMLSYAASETGRGWGFGLHKALDQSGALLGPLMVALLLLLHHGVFRAAFAWLALPAVLALATLFAARSQYRNPRELEKTRTHEDHGFSAGGVWFYTVTVGLLAAAYTDFPLIAFHLSRRHLFSSSSVPLLYSLGMGAEAITALIFGHLLDRAGFWTTIAGTVIGLLFAPLVFLGGKGLVIAGMLVWGLGLGLQESAMRAVLGSMVAPERRASAYGAFDTLYGIFWFAGSALMGALYDRSLMALVWFSAGCQALAVVLLLRFRRLKTVGA